MDQTSPQTLVETLRLERLEVNLFRGTSPDTRPGHLFGGQVIAQSLLAAYETVEDRICHSLHCYFIRQGDPTVPIVFEVDRSRDGGSFTTRRVIAVQHGQQIFNLAASFQVAEAGLEHQLPMPAAPGWAELPDEIEGRSEMMKDVPEAARRWMDRHRPIEVRGEESQNYIKGVSAEPESQSWIRCRDPVGADLRLNQVVLAYASDINLLSTAMRPHGVHWRMPHFQTASLDHAMWFHRPVNIENWHLYVHDSPSASGGRGFIRGSIYAEDGTLVASVAQEGLIRFRKPKP
jgi:acyl-CoA thioesterase-2